MISYASTAYASWSALAATLQDDIAINWFWLQNENIITSFVWEQTNIDLQTFNIPTEDGKGFLGYYKRGKNITLKLTIKESTTALFQTRLDNLRRELFKEESLLDIKVNGTIRRIKVNCVSAPKILEHYNITFIQMEIAFQTLESFFYEIWKQSSIFQSKTASFDEDITNQGTDITFPVVYIQFKTWLSSVTSTAFTINSNTLTISETINDNDVIIIDWEEKTVTINWTEVDYSGVFPFMWTTLNAFNFTINGTWEADFTVLNKINYV